MIPIMIIVMATIFFFILERVLPGRELPEAPGWFARAALINACQLGTVVLAGVAWERWMQRWSLFHISDWMSPPVQGFLGAATSSLETQTLARRRGSDICSCPLWNGA